MAEGLTYKAAGVDIKLGDLASEIMYKASVETWKNREDKIGEVFIPYEHFSGLRGMNIDGLPSGAIQGINYDGIGTKIEIAERTGNHGTMAYDLFAMLCDDAVRRSVEPIWVGSVLDVNTLGKDSQDNHLDCIQELADGMVDAAKEAGVAVINGEVAELGNRVQGYGEFCYNWGGSVLWAGTKDKSLAGFDIGPCLGLVGLRENGFRSNGISLLRKVLKDKYGDRWHEADYKGQSLGKVALHPSKIYTGAVIDMIGGFDEEDVAAVQGIAHITGGGIPGKLGRALRPSGSGAVIDDPFEPCDLMLHCQEIGPVTDKEAYSTWNMGNGMIIVSSDPWAVIEIAEEHSIEAKLIGEVRKEPGIEIISKGFHNTDERLLFK